MIEDGSADQNRSITDPSSRALGGDMRVAPGLTNGRFNCFADPVSGEAEQVELNANAEPLGWYSSLSTTYAKKRAFGHTDAQMKRTTAHFRHY